MLEAESAAPQSSVCPVCRLPGLGGAALACPQCDADLRCFRALEILAQPAAPAAAAEPVSPSRIESTPRRALLVAGGTVLGVLLVLLGSWIFWWLRPDARPTAASPLPQAPRCTDEAKRRRAAVASREPGGRKRQASAAEKAVAKAEAANVKPTVRAGKAALYQARPEDNLWVIAARLYGRGDCYPLLLVDNPGLSVYRIGAGVTLRMVGDQDEAARRCRALIHRDESGRFWYYRLRAGDSPESVARRYLGTDSAAARVEQLNAGLPWKAGQKIKLHLP